MNNWKKVAVGGGSAGILLAAVVGVYEGTRYTPYQDVTGVWTNCQGNTHGVAPGKVMTPEECHGVDAINQSTAFSQLHKVVKVPLNRNETVAFADLIYNAGIKTFTTSCSNGNCRESTILKDINSGNIMNGCRDLLMYTRAGGRVMAGLVNRRNAEYTICITKESTEGFSVIPCNNLLQGFFCLIHNFPFSSPIHNFPFSSPIKFTGFYKLLSLF